MRQKSVLTLFLSCRGALVDYASGIVGDRAQAEDLVQDAWLRLDDVARDRVLDRPLGYLYRIVRNLALDLTRRRGLEQRREADGPDWWMLPATPRTPEEEVSYRQDLSRLERCLATMEPRMRTAVEMHRFGGFTLEEIADRLRLSPATAHRLVRDGLLLLASGLSGDER